MRTHLHLLTAVIAPGSLDEVIEELRRAGIWGVTVTEAHGVGHGRPHVERYRGAEYVVQEQWCVLEVVVDTFDAERLAELVAVTATGGGEVRITPIDGLLRIRTGEMGVDAL